MSNEMTDLDWLARNVHDWPDGTCSYIHMMVIKEIKYPSWSRYDGDGKYTKAQWLARRADLQNKPSWAAAPEWARWLSQDADGRWFFYADTPSGDGKKGWRIEGSGVNEGFCSGETLGDWRDTLERRPKEFQPFTSIEDNQEKVMKQDSGWFERGELPPAGTECEAATEGCKYEKCEILAFHKGQVALRWFEFNDGCLDVLELDGWSFRPIRTEREVAIEEMMKTINVIEFVGTPHHLISEISAVMYDAGYRKEQK